MSGTIEGAEGGGYEVRSFSFSSPLGIFLYLSSHRLCNFSRVWYFERTVAFMLIYAEYTNFEVSPDGRIQGVREFLLEDTPQKRCCPPNYVPRTQQGVGLNGKPFFRHLTSETVPKEINMRGALYLACEMHKEMWCYPKPRPAPPGPHLFA